MCNLMPKASGPHVLCEANCKVQSPTDNSHVTQQCPIDLKRQELAAAPKDDVVSKE